jgi:hypothetical protein
MSAHRYLRGKLVADYLRGGLGFAGTGGIWLALPPLSPAVNALFGGLTLLFLLFTIRTAWRQAVRIELSDEAISRTSPGLTSSRQGSLAWRDIVAVKLRYYSSRRGRKDGWLTLRLVGAETRIAIDSDLEGFDEIARRAALAASRKELRLDEVTRANFAAIGFPTDAPAVDAQAVAPRRDETRS